MVLNELVQRSPIRIFEQSINGGLKAGEIGVIASPTGVGKTSVLVQLALDKLLQDKKVIHVSFGHNNQYIPSWYEDIFTEFIGKKNLENADEIKNALAKNRVQMNFNQDGVTNTQIIKSLKAMIVEGAFKADAVIIDGFDFSRAEKDNVEVFEKFAEELGICVWYSCSVKDNQYDKENIPVELGGFIGNIDIVIVLEPKPDHIELSISKDRDAVVSKSMAMKLDPKTLLILEA